MALPQRRDPVGPVGVADKSSLSAAPTASAGMRLKEEAQHSRRLAIGRAVVHPMLGRSSRPSTHPRQLPRVGPAGLDRLAVSRPPKDPLGVENPRADPAGGDATGRAEEAPLSPALRAGPHPGLFGPGERSGKPCGIRRPECARLLLPHGIVTMARADQGVRDLVKDHPAHGVGVIKLGQRA